MKLLINFFKHYSIEARKKRALLFKKSFHIDKDTKILDLGSEDGSNIFAVLKSSSYDIKNIYIADIQPNLVERGSEKYGFTPVIIDESGRLPFNDDFFDIVYCSSVIEHVTAPKNDIWNITSTEKFRKIALARQSEFAKEIRRLGQQYFVQTPFKNFPIESHSWLPFVVWLPRKLLIQVLSFTNKFWIKKTSPDWYLLNEIEMNKFFGDAAIKKEKIFGFTKSLIAIKSNYNN